MLRFLTLILVISLMGSAQANVPSAFIKLKNLKYVSPDKDKVRKQWNLFWRREENGEALKVPGKEYKDDHFCIFTVELLEDGKLDLDSMKLDEHNGNYSYNLKIIEFLRNKKYKFEVKNPKKVSKIEFRYLAF